MDMSKETRALLTSTMLEAAHSMSAFYIHRYLTDGIFISGVSFYLGSKFPEEGVKVTITHSAVPLATRSDMHRAFHKMVADVNKKADDLAKQYPGVRMTRVNTCDFQHLKTTFVISKMG